MIDYEESPESYAQQESERRIAARKARNDRLACVGEAIREVLEERAELLAVTERFVEWFRQWRLPSPFSPIQCEPIVADAKAAIAKAKGG